MPRPRIYQNAEEQRVGRNQKQNERRGKQHKVNSQIPKTQRLISSLALKREEERARAMEEQGAREKEALDLKAHYIALLQEFNKKQPINGVSFTQAQAQAEAGMVGGATVPTDQAAQHQETAPAMVQPAYYDPVRDMIKRE